MIAGFTPATAGKPAAPAGHFFQERNDVSAERSDTSNSGQGGTQEQMFNRRSALAGRL
jgi:hypothetical protein